MSYQMRLLPPVALTARTITVAPGRSYTAAPGAALDVVDFDAQVLTSNGWLLIGKSGTTTQRHAYSTPMTGEAWYDTTLSAVACWDGATWRNPAGTSI